MDDKHNCGSCKSFIPGQNSSWNNYFYHYMQSIYHINRKLYNMMSDAHLELDNYYCNQRCKSFFKTHWNFITGDQITYDECREHNKDGLCKKWEPQEVSKPKKRWWRRKINISYE